MNRKILKTPSGERSLEPKPCKSILKRVESPYSTKKENILKPHASGGVKSVKFKKSKFVQQARLRSKLNEWLETKGKTPSRYLNLMYFDEQLSAKKKRDKSLSGKLSEDLVGKQIHSLQKEEDQRARKKLFNNDARDQTRQSTPVASRRSGGLNQKPLPKITPRRSSDSRRSATQDTHANVFSDKSNKSVASSHAANQTKKVPLYENVTNFVKSPAKEPSPEPEITDDHIQQNVLSMLQECLTLFRAGCPPEHILSWLENMEQHIPQTKTFALFYACKAELFTNDPSGMLEVFCQGVENKAQPSQLLSDAMRQFLAPHLPHPEGMLPLNSSLSQSHNELHSSLNGDGHLVKGDDYDLLSEDTLHSSTCPGEEKNGVPTTTTEYTGLLKSETPAKKDVLTKRRSTMHTPVKESDPVLEGTPPQLGSTIKYAVSAATPLPGQSPKSVPKCVVTPVRRSTRLSNRHPTPQAQREIDSVLDLTLKEAETTMFFSNPAIEEN